jgi:hypothetical protein
MESWCANLAERRKPGSNEGAPGVAPSAQPESEPTAPVTSKPRVAAEAGRVSIATMASRVLGLAREQVMAAFFGAGMMTDAFNVAFRVPNLLRDLFAEGALSAAFIPTFTATDHKERPRRSLAAGRAGDERAGACARARDDRRAGRSRPGWSGCSRRASPRFPASSS